MIPVVIVGGVAGAVAYRLSFLGMDRSRRLGHLGWLFAATAGAAVAWRGPNLWVGFAFGWFAGSATALGEIDLAEMRIPRRVVFTAAAVGAVALGASVAADGPWRAFVDAGASAVGVYAVLLSLHLIAPRGFGYGDVRMGALCAFFAGYSGWRVALDAVLIASVGASIVGGALIATRLVARQERLPFGPFLALGTIAAILLT